jgi:integrase
MRWNAIDWKRGDIAVNRLKGSKSNRQPLDGNDLRALRALYRGRTSDEWIFMGESVARSPAMASASSCEPLPTAPASENVHPHALRHACGHALAMKGRDMRLVQEYMGHANVQNTARYMDGVSARFRGIWD